MVDEAVGEERRRIARELHDVVGNNLTVISLHARTGGRSRDDSHLALIDETAQQAMREMGTILHLLRQDPAAAVDSEPVGLADVVRAAVDEVSAVGAPVQMRFRGQDVTPPAGVRHVVRRAVREALINGIKHGPYEQARVELWVHDEIEIRVLTRAAEPGTGTRSHLAGTGLGLRGLAEEVHSYGGVVRSGSSNDGWFCVRVRIPLVWNKPAPAAALTG